MRSRVLCGDCIEVMRDLEGCSIDAIVTDPPYGLGFMGKKWDDLPPGVEFADAALRVLKPGGYVLAFGGSRTYHRLACAVEDAGFEIRDQIMWIYGSGFPKSHNISKAIDKTAGAEREVIGRVAGMGKQNPEWNGTAQGRAENSFKPEYDQTTPATPEAERWDGWGTALKPAHEPIVVARKPLAGTVAENVLRFGTGALNIDGCRIGTPESKRAAGSRTYAAGKLAGGMNGDGRLQDAPHDGLGRWPANVILDEEAGRLLDEQSGRSVSKVTKFNVKGRSGGILGADGADRNYVGGFNDTGGASRFFYCAKASKGERNAGLDGFEERKTRGNYGDGIQDNRPHTRNGYTYEATTKNVHPTVKPISLMRYLVRLVTPPGGVILDPFLGSGTTGCAAALEGFEFVGIEREPEYVKIAEARIAYWSAQPVQMELGDAA